LNQMTSMTFQSVAIFYISYIFSYIFNDILPGEFYERWP